MGAVPSMLSPPAGGMPSRGGIHLFASQWCSKTCSHDALQSPQKVSSASESLRPFKRVRVHSRRGFMEARVVLEAGVGRVFIPMHDGAVNRLTLPVFDPYSRQPSYKSCAVRLEPLGETTAPGKQSLGVGHSGSR